MSEVSLAEYITNRIDFNNVKYVDMTNTMKCVIFGPFGHLLPTPQFTKSMRYPT